MFGSNSSLCSVPVVPSPVCCFSPPHDEGLGVEPVASEFNSFYFHINFYSSIGTNLSFLRLQRGQRHVSGRSSNSVPGGMFCLGSPLSGSYVYLQGHLYFVIVEKSLFLKRRDDKTWCLPVRIPSHLTCRPFEEKLIASRCCYTCRCHETLLGGGPLAANG